MSRFDRIFTHLGYVSTKVMCIFVSAVAMTLSVVHSANAVTPVYADNSGGACNGLTPCLATIQLAVNMASDPDGAGPLAAEVFVFPGEYNESVDLTMMDGGTMGDIQLITVGPTGVPTPGTVRIENTAETIMQSGGAFTGDVTINGFILHSTMDDGISLTVNSDIAILNVTANFCGDGGGDEGVRATALSGNVLIINSTANSTTGDDGFDIGASIGNVTVVNCSADGNDGDGFDINAGGTITVDGATASGNGMAGFNLGADGNISVTDTIANGNGTPGIDTTSENNITIVDVTANNNGNEGLQINVDGDLVVMNATTIANITQGVEVDHGPGANLVNNVDIQNVWIQGSGLDGISLSDLAPGGNHRVNGSIICSNFGSALDLGSNVTVNATGNYWGDLSGPTHTGNPAGLGDVIEDSATTGNGTVTFIPFINTITGSVAPDPALVGVDALVSFQFSDAAMTVFLGEGPGDRNEQEPFILSTDNGTLTSSSDTAATVTERINNLNGIVSVILSNAVAGTANVDVDPCGLIASLAVTVDTDSDGDGVGDSLDGCPADPAKTVPGVCGCGVADTDSDGDGVSDCIDQCPAADDTADGNGNGVPDCLEPPPPPPPGCCAPGVFPTVGVFVPALLVGRRIRRRRAP